jgi:hypothetical protein
MSIHINAFRALLLAAFGAAVLGRSLSAQPGADRATSIKPGESCPQGTTEIRPRQCMGPEAAAPSILDYRPRSTLVVPEHDVRKARYPAIDFHGHPQGMLGSVESLARLGADLDGLNVRMMIVANNVSGDALTRTVATINTSPSVKNRVRRNRSSGRGFEKGGLQKRVDGHAGVAANRVATLNHSQRKNLVESAV